MLVLVIRTLLTDVSAREAPFGASLVRITLLLMTTLTGPLAAIAPPAPLLGVPLTAAIGVTSGPAFILLFLVAIARGQREADEDDAKYMK